MCLLCISENIEYKYLLVFVGYSDESEGLVIELIYNWGVDSYEMGMVFGYLVLGVDDVVVICD